MAWVYILRGLPVATTSVRLSILMHVSRDIYAVTPATTKRLGDQLEIVAKKEVATLGEARKIERAMKQKNPKIAIYHLQR